MVQIDRKNHREPRRRNPNRRYLLEIEGREKKIPPVLVDADNLEDFSYPGPRLAKIQEHRINDTVGDIFEGFPSRFDIFVLFLVRTKFFRKEVFPAAKEVARCLKTKEEYNLRKLFKPMNLWLEVGIARLKSVGFAGLYGGLTGFFAVGIAKTVGISAGSALEIPLILGGVAVAAGAHLTGIVGSEYLQAQYAEITRKFNIRQRGRRFQHICRVAMEQGNHDVAYSAAHQFAVVATQIDESNTVSFEDTIFRIMKNTHDMTVLPDHLIQEMRPELMRLRNISKEVQEITADKAVENRAVQNRAEGHSFNIGSLTAKPEGQAPKYPTADEIAKKPKEAKERER